MSNKILFTSLGATRAIWLDNAVLNDGAKNVHVFKTKYLWCFVLMVLPVGITVVELPCFDGLIYFGGIDVFSLHYQLEAASTNS